MLKKAFRLIAWIFFAILLFLGVLILVATFSDFKPDEIATLKTNENPDILQNSQEMDVMIWNIGYSGLDASMDFFYDGGKQVRPSFKNVQNNLEAIQNFLLTNDSVEFFLLQEADISSRRSYGVNQYDSIRSVFPGYQSFKAVNYDVFFVPLPVMNPMGRVLSGLQTLSKFKPTDAKRYSFPGNYAWPKNLFMLDRCFLVNRYPLNNGKNLILVNTHNSAYDDGSLRKMQMEYLREFLLKEEGKGNYIVVGGDWNQSPPGLKKEFKGHVFDTANYSEVRETYLPAGWKWAWDPGIPTNRRVATVYDKGNTPVTLIDFFLVSPNVKVEEIKGVDLDFINSDHQPVILKFGFK
jgi:endonuclease/exonuclease/phosphatase family metal-dependent hydrolase